MDYLWSNICVHNINYENIQETASNQIATVNLDEEMYSNPLSIYEPVVSKNFIIVHSVIMCISYSIYRVHLLCSHWKL